MKFELPGQLKGPECKPVISEAIKLRRVLEPWAANLDNDKASLLSVVLRIDGSLGSFGAEGVEEIQLKNSCIACDLVISDRGWTNLQSDEISSILRVSVKDAICQCLDKYDIEYSVQDIENAMTGKL